MCVVSSKARFARSVRNTIVMTIISMCSGCHTSGPSTLSPPKLTATPRRDRASAHNARRPVASPEQTAAARDLAATRRKQYKIPPEKIISYDEVQETVYPGKLFSREKNTGSHRPQKKSFETP